MRLSSFYKQNKVIACNCFYKYKANNIYLPDVDRILQVTAPLPAFSVLTVMQYSSPLCRFLCMPSVILHLSAWKLYYTVKFVYYSLCFNLRFLWRMLGLQKAPLEHLFRRILRLLCISHSHPERK